MAKMSFSNARACKCEVCAENRDRGAEQNAEGQGPALIKSGENQEHEDEGETEDRPRWNALLCLLFLERHARVIEACAGRHGLMEDFFERLSHLAGTVAGRAGDVELRGVELVEAVDEFGAGDLADFYQRAERHLAAVGAAHVELVDVRDVRSRCAFGFNVGLPLPAEAIEVVHEIAAHERLHRGVDVGEVDLLLRAPFPCRRPHRAAARQADKREWRLQSPGVWKWRRGM